MHDVIYKRPVYVARYRAGPFAEEREHFLANAHADGYSLSTLRRMAWVLLIIARVAHRHGGSLTASQLEELIGKAVRVGRDAHLPCRKTATMFLRFGTDWLSSIGALLPESSQPLRFSSELDAFIKYMRVERGLSEVTITTRKERMRIFFAALPEPVRSLGDVTIDHIDAFLESHSVHGWGRSSLQALGSSLRNFFRYAAQQGWCRSSLVISIDVPHLYVLEDVPKALTGDAVDRLLDATAAGDDAVTIRDHAILSLLIHYGLRRGEVGRLTLDDLDWVMETLHVTRPKQRRAQSYPLSAAVGDAILRYIREARPRCTTRAVFLACNAPFRPLASNCVSKMVNMRLKQQGLKLNGVAAHCLRHSCASQLLEAGFTLKHIADHLGDRSMESTRIYTKIDLRGLRQVAELDLGALL